MTELSSSISIRCKKHWTTLEMLARDKTGSFDRNVSGEEKGFMRLRPGRVGAVGVFIHQVVTVQTFHDGTLGKTMIIIEYDY
jgi:hypothetical protein